jgi:hypothetical protein
LAVAHALFALACSPTNNGFDSADGDATIDRTDVPPYEAAMDVPLLGRVCTTNAQCDDAIACTDDQCGPDNRCVNIPVSGRCDNNNFCDGPERCDTRRGCVRGEPVSCDDNLVCTEDRCVEDTRTCEHRPLDRDGDGDPDDHCHAVECGDAGVPEPDTGVMTACWRGHDCNDSDPRVNSVVPEICGDMIDNNCNGAVDDAEPGGCSRAPHDRCDDPLDVSAGGDFALQMAAAQPDYTLRCAGGIAHDIVARLHLDAPHDIDITGDSPTAVVGVALQSVCGSTTPSDTLECDFGFPGRIRRHSLPAGDYFILVGTSGSGDVDLTVRITDATPQPTNDTCATPITIPLSGLTYRSDLIGANDDISTSCGGGGRDHVYTFTLPSPMNVTLQLAGGRTDYLGLSLATDCVPLPNVLRCDAGSTIDFTAHQLAAGTYFVFVESFDPVFYTLQATFSAPTPPAMGDTCADPLTLTEGTPITVPAGTMENDYNLSCATSGRDAVVQFTLPTRRDVLIDADAGGFAYFGVSIGSTCPPTSATESVCSQGASPRTFALGLDPGTYYAIVKPSRDADYNVSLTTYPPIALTPVTMNDVCSQATTIPMGRGYFSGDTSALRDDYSSTCAGATRGKDAVFSLHLDVRSRVTFVTDTSFFHVVWLMQGLDCPGTEPMAVTGNDCTLGTHTTLDATLPPGDYWFILDGLSSGYEGTYTLLTLVSPT